MNLAWCSGSSQYHVPWTESYHEYVFQVALVRSKPLQLLTLSLIAYGRTSSHSQRHRSSEEAPTIPKKWFRALLLSSLLTRCISTTQIKVQLKLFYIMNGVDSWDSFSYWRVWTSRTEWSRESPVWLVRSAIALVSEPPFVVVRHLIWSCFRWMEKGMLVWLTGHVPPSAKDYFPDCVRRVICAIIQGLIVLLVYAISWAFFKISRHDFRSLIRSNLF